VSAKINIDTDNRMSMTGQIRRVLAEDPTEFDPRKYLMPAQAAASGIQHRRTGVEVQTCRDAR